MAHDGPQVSQQLQATFGWADPFHDPGVGEFGLQNSVFAAGDTFIEVVSPVTEGTTAGRYLERRGGDTGYMAIFQVDDIHKARDRVDAAGVRIVWHADLPDIAGTHLHPRDVPGAIVSLDWADPSPTWRWAGPEWTGRTPAAPGPGSIAGLTIAVHDPVAAARRWADVVGLAVGVSAAGDQTLRLEGGAQIVRFVPVTGDRGDRGDGIVEVALRTDGRGPDVAEIGGVRFVRV